MALTARERQILAGGAASAASEVTGASFRAPGMSIRPYILPSEPGGVNLFGQTVGDPSLGVQEAGLAGLVPLIIGGLGKAWPWLAGAGAGASIAGLLGPGNGNGAVASGTQYGVPFGGPGLKEPGGKYLLKEWHIRLDSKEGDFSLQFYLTQNDAGRKRVFMYNTRTKAWKSWAPPRLSVIGKNMPSHQMITRLRRNLKRHADDAVTILKLTSPGKLESTHKRGGRYVKGRKRWVD